jgi:hypothetical protein
LEESEKTENIFLMWVLLGEYLLDNTVAKTVAKTEASTYKETN